VSPSFDAHLSEGSEIGDRYSVSPDKDLSFYENTPPTESSSYSSDDGDDIVFLGTQPVVDAKHLKFTALSLKPGCDVILQDLSFLHITKYDPDREVITGYRLLLQNHCELLMTPRDHEVVQLVQTTEDLHVHYILSTVAIDSVVKNCKVVFTNQPYTSLCYAKHVRVIESDDSPIYFCRYFSADTNIGLDDIDPQGPPKSGRIQRLRYNQAESGILITKDGYRIQIRIPDSELRNQWRGETHLGGTYVDPSRMSERKYTCGDCFAGAGGTSCGAYTAGLKMDFAFDYDECAKNTYDTNFGHTGVRVLERDVQNFVAEARDAGKAWVVDILHLSPPCQPFCGANRRPNEEEDRANIAAFERVPDLLEISKPRIVTLEEAKTLTDCDKREFFKKILAFFIKKNFSVQWKVTDLWQYGVPQTRRRTIIIAAA
jgi:16S rRNA G966 N2-methylase RsmD